MHRSLLVLTALSALVIAGPRTATAASSPSGTIACAVAGDPITGLRISPPISLLPSPIRPIFKDTVYGSCDDSGVSGGKGPIDTVEAKLLARLAAGTTCLDLVTAPEFTFVKLRLKWKGPNEQGRVRTVATSVAHLVSGSWDPDTEGLVFAGELFKGAFVGSTVTMRLTLDTPELFNATCPWIEGVRYGADGESVITVP